MSAGRDAFTSLLGMVDSAIAGKPADEREDRLARLGVLWWSLLEKMPAPSAERLVRAMWGHLSRYRPESPAPLDTWPPPGEPNTDPRGHAA